MMRKCIFSNILSQETKLIFHEIDSIIFPIRSVVFKKLLKTLNAKCAKSSWNCWCSYSICSPFSW
jgi:hypothetical protein